ncbi:MAG: S8 family serine peptidase, partial [Pseudobdellovibrionaceae bacterium]
MKFWEPKTLLILLSLAVLTACQPSSSGSGKKTGKKNNTQIPIDEIKDQFALLGDPKETAFQDRKYSFTSTAVSPFKDGTFKLEDAPSWLSVDSTTGEVSGTPNDVLSAFIYKLIFEASVQAEAVGTYPLTVFGNPLKKYQWHLTNTGQKTFSANAGTAGEDINMSKTVNSGITGLGVKIAISDTAAEMNHEALVLNAIQNASRDYTLSYPYNTSLFAKLLDRDSSTGKKPEHHATAVSGIAVGRGWNNVGIRGVAPFAKFAVFNYVAWNVTQTTEKSLDQLQGNFDVFNQSWGVSARYSLEYDWDYDNFLFDQIKKGRDGKGPVYVRAGGNGFDVDSDSSVFASQAVGSDPYNATPYVIVVGALNAKGERASYSSIGSALWISAPGGEFGDDDPAMLTADLSGCSEGKSKTTATFNSFDKGI